MNANRSTVLSDRLVNDTICGQPVSAHAMQCAWAPRNHFPSRKGRERGRGGGEENKYQSSSLLSLLPRNPSFSGLVFLRPTQHITCIASWQPEEDRVSVCASFPPLHISLICCSSKTFTCGEVTRPISGGTYNNRHCPLELRDERQ